MPTVTISATASIDDTFIYNNPGFTDLNFGGSTAVIIGQGSGITWRGLVRFDLSSIPTGKLITGFRIKSYQLANGFSTQATTIDAYIVSNANTWVEGSSPGFVSSEDGACDWNHCKHATQSWAGSAGCGTSGTDYDSSSSPSNCTIGPLTSGGPTAFTLELDPTWVDAWVNSGRPNNGIFLRGHSESEGKLAVIGSADNSTSPLTIEVDYEIPVTTGKNTRQVIDLINTTNGWGVIYPWQRKIFFCNGLYWVFYADGAPSSACNHIYITSADGITWSSQATVRSTTLESSGHRIAYWCDGTYIHYVFGDGQGDLSAGALRYRRGLLNVDGTITWSAQEQTIFSDSGFGGAYPTICVDSNGCPWVGCIYYTSPPYGAPRTARVYKSSKSDGTWTTDTGFPYDLFTVPSAAHLPVPASVPLTSGKVYWAWTEGPASDGLPLRGRLWNGSSWDAQENASTYISGSSVFNLVSEGDVVHIAYADGTNSVMKYRRRAANGTWGSDLTISRVNPIGSHVTMSLWGTNKVRVYWMDSTTNQYYIGDVQGESTTTYQVIDESADQFTPSNVTSIGNAMVNVGSAPGALSAYTVKTTAPYKLVLLFQLPSTNSVHMMWKIL